LVRVALVSLGCPKNLVDSECVLGEIAEGGYEIVTDKAQADVIIINTCGFIESAREDSINEILDAVQFKKSGACRALLAIGCMAQKFADELAAKIPEVDAFLGVGHAGAVTRAIKEVLKGERLIEAAAPPRWWVEPAARIRSTPPWTAYLKVSDGCDNRCAYCAIPDIRGPFRSRPEGFVLDEARRLADEGVKEIVLVGQDLTQYGADLGGGESLTRLLEKLNEIDSLVWVRLLYAYPTKITPELIEAIGSLEKVAKYLDIPMQHGDDRMLSLMGRKGETEDYLRVIDALRSRCPEIALRSSFIVGFPGETRQAFDSLMRFVGRIQFDRVGVFTYSREVGTPAADMPGQVPERTARARLDRLMRLQQGISLAKNAEFLGRDIGVLVERVSGDCRFGRSYRDAPEIDGVVYIKNSRAKPGDFVTVRITEALEYDLVGTSADATIEKRGAFSPKRRKHS
jgi:ribosomal protein S12 methylthiotransferase